MGKLFSFYLFFVLSVGSFLLEERLHWMMKDEAHWLLQPSADTATNLLLFHLEHWATGTHPGKLGKRSCRLKIDFLVFGRIGKRELDVWNDSLYHFICTAVRALSVRDDSFLLCSFMLPFLVFFILGVIETRLFLFRLYSPPFFLTSLPFAILFL